jgi:tetratricopeptide (TPR) repeat protein
VAGLALLPYLLLPAKPLIYDAHLTIVANAAVQSGPLARLFAVDFWGIAADETNTRSYRPLVSLTYALQARMWGFGALLFQHRASRAASPLPWKLGTLALLAAALLSTEYAVAFPLLLVLSDLALARAGRGGPAKPARWVWLGAFALLAGGLVISGGLVGRRVQDWSSMERLARASVAAYPRGSESWMHLGAALAERGALDEAAAALERAIELNPREARAWTVLAQVTAGLGREAEAMLREILVASPDHAPTLFNLARVLVLDGRPVEAERSLVRGLEVQDDARARELLEQIRSGPPAGLACRRGRGVRSPCRPGSPCPSARRRSRRGSRTPGPRPPVGRPRSRSARHGRYARSCR